MRKNKLNGEDVIKIMSLKIQQFLDGEIKSDALNSTSQAMKALMAPINAKQKEASINKEKTRTDFLDCEL